MPDLAIIVPARRPELVIRPLGDLGRYVIKDPGSGEFFHIGEQEQFLLTNLDGAQTAQDVCSAFSERFREPLSQSDFNDFLSLARSKGLLQSEKNGPPKATSVEPGAPTSESVPERAVARTAPSPSSQSILYWRKSLFDPDRFCTWLEPRIRFFWTSAFFVFSALCIALAVILVSVARPQLVTSFTQAMRWETVLWAWLTLLIVTTLHEFAHGLTCKHYGGEVHEIGFLLMFFMPCFFCNVSDAWLFKEKSKRLWVTLAGGYFELFLWALAVFIWRLTLPGTLLNYLAFVVQAVCGVRTLFNFNPLLKLDGYYLLSDWVEIPNLQQRSLARFKAQTRRLLWGAPAPTRDPRGRFLSAFGLATWLYGVVFIVLMLWAMFAYLRTSENWLAVGFVGLLAWASLRRLFRDFCSGEVRNMIIKRFVRTALWLVFLAGLVAALVYVPLDDRAAGAFQVRPALRVEVRAPLAGFLQTIYFDEGDRVSPGAVVAHLHVPDLASRLAQKQAEAAEIQARVKLLEIGARPEEIAEQRGRALRAQAWRDLAQKDLACLKQTFAEELVRLDKQIAQHRAEVDAAQGCVQRARQLRGGAALAEEQFHEAERKLRVSEALLGQAEAEKRIRQAKGLLEAEAELARREKDGADAQALLRLLEAGARPEEIAAERARLARAQEEVHHLEDVRKRLTVCTTGGGVVTTPRLKETVGQYYREGDLICLIEEPNSVEVEITVAEEDVARVAPGQEIALKVRALPFETLSARVVRVAPAAAHGDVQAKVTVYGRLEACPAELLPGMTGYARIYTGPTTPGNYLGARLLRYLRTEFWW